MASSFTHIHLLEPDHATDDRVLTERMARGDLTATRELYLRYFERLVRFAYSYVHSRDIAEEVVQDVFLAVWERREVLELRHGIRVYLFTAVRNRALRWHAHEDVVARTAHRSTELEQAPGMGSAEVRPDTQLEHQALSQALARTIAGMPERRRMAMMLRWREQLPYADIAEIMGVSVEAATIHVARAREALARVVREFREEV